MQSNFSLVDNTCLKWTAVKKLSKHNNQYVFVVKAVNHRAVTHLTLPYFWTVACGVITKDCIKITRKSYFIFGHTRAHTQEAPKKSMVNCKVSLSRFS